jgi:integrase
MSPPSVPEQPVPILTDAELVALLATCKGQSLENRRDEAVIRMFIDTGIRASELVGLKVDDVPGLAAGAGNGQGIRMRDLRLAAHQRHNVEPPERDRCFTCGWVGYLRSCRHSVAERDSYRVRADSANFRRRLSGHSSRLHAHLG